MAAVGTGADAASGGAQVIITIDIGITVGILGIITQIITILRRHRRQAVLAIILHRHVLALRAMNGIITAVRRAPITIGTTIIVLIVPIGIITTSQADQIAPVWTSLAVRYVQI